MTLPENSVMFVNIAVIGAIILSLIIGYIKGFLLPILNTLAILIIILISWILSPGLSELIRIFPERWAPFNGTSLAEIFYGKINTLCWFVIVFVVGCLIIAVIRPLFKAVTELPIVKQVNKSIGAVLSLIPVAIVIILVTYLLNTALFTNGKDVIEGSVLRYTDVVTDKVVSILSDTFKENVAIQKMISDPLSLTDKDLSSIIEWLQNSKISSEEIKEFLTNYGIEVDKINELIQSLENNIGSENE